MIRGKGVSNATYNCAANLVTSALGGPEALERRIRARDPAFNGVFVRRYMLADRAKPGDNEATPGSLAAVLQRLAARNLPGLRPETIEVLPVHPQFFEEQEIPQHDPQPALDLRSFIANIDGSTIVTEDAAARPTPRHYSAKVVYDEMVLVVANETVRGEELMEAMGELSLAAKTEFIVVCPALTSRLKTWTSDEDPGRAEAQRRLDETLARLAEVGIQARGEVGDGDPLVAIEDAVRLFHPDEIVISTHPEGRSNWLERGVVGAARERFDVPVTHVVVDVEG